MSVFAYRKFKISISEDSKKTQGLRVGDIVRRQYWDDQTVIYSLMCVLDTGTDVVPEIENDSTIYKERHWFIGALLEGDAPSSSEILDFVRITNLWDANRLGAIVLTATDDQSPYIDIIDGIAVEQSLCFPSSLNNVSWIDDFSQYHITAPECFISVYKSHELDNTRICSLTRNSHVTNSFVGLAQTIDKQLGNPDRVLIAYKVKSSRDIEGLTVSLGYEDDTRIDGTLTINATTKWTYQVHIITIDFSDRYKRKFKLDLSLLQENDIIEIADFNIILLSSIANFAGGMKIRMGKLNGVSDPVFGELENYGAYIQRLYATKQVNISGTLTAGDENGFASTFYVGKIHKNVVINSLKCHFSTDIPVFPTLNNPVGIGSVYKSPTSFTLNIQTNKWLLGKIGQKYCFSCWLKTHLGQMVMVSQNGQSIKSLEVEGGDTWKRYSFSFDIQNPSVSNAPLQISFTFQDSELYFVAPQMEKGTYATQYQPTDDILAYVEDYGAWFNKGGIGGTIQNPLLRLNNDGSISSRNNSFAINNDGSGHVGNGNIEFDDKTVSFHNVVLKWEDIDQQFREEIKPKYIKLVSADNFTWNGDTYTPSQINIQVLEYNFSSSDVNRKWYYLRDNEYVLLEGQTGLIFTVDPNAAYWNNQNDLTIKCVINYNDVDIVDSVTINKLKHGANVYAINIESTNGMVFKNGQGETILHANVYYGSMNITGLIAKDKFDWIRKSDNSIVDEEFNKTHKQYGYQLHLTAQEVITSPTVTYDCIVSLDSNMTGEGYVYMEHYQSGMEIPDKCIVKMRDKYYVSKHATYNPPLGTLKSKTQRRLKSTKGYLLTGYANTQDYTCTLN